MENLANELWGHIPLNIRGALNDASKIRKDYDIDPSQLEYLVKGLKSHLRSLGICTKKVEENLDKLGNGVIEAGQQPSCMAGAGLVINKIACISKFSELSRDGSYAPIFYVADYDGVQNELLNIRIPSLSMKGCLISIPVEDSSYGIPIYMLKKPEEEWLKDSLNKILNNYRGLLRGLKEDDRKIKLKHLEHVFTIIKSTYYSAENVSDWSTKILGTIINIESDLGVPFLVFSAEPTRCLFQRGYELLVAEPNRTRFIEAINRTIETIQKSGYTPQIGIRKSSYTPFFLECMNRDCERRRIELVSEAIHGSGLFYVKGKCPACGEEYQYSFSKQNPDLSEIIQWISPRVDSRQIIVDSIIPVICHIGGSGEAGYYSEITPAARELNLPFPIFFKYTRIFYNTPWNSAYASNLEAKNCPSLVNRDFFSSLNRWVEARNNQDPQRLENAYREIEESITATFETLNIRLNTLEKEVSEIREQLQKLNDGSMVALLKEKQSLINLVNLYLSSQFGRFTPEKFGQEVSWSWIDVAVISGLQELTRIYLRQYFDYTLNSTMFYVNL
ncbi:bacillithiol biosynthesis BshC [Candidatus Bathyarchaeota archaeon]|nr:bacillithiol biosynthesis BshC [Candidatus Bathyarchaeota archaeon]MBS7631036.1 bacillithiol biosynthesis BshC [Candidatus Bathyarchaeota archaeon]